MLLASIITLTAAFARWPGVSGTGVIVYFPLNDLVLIPLIIWDRRTLGRMHPATRWASGWLPLSQPPRIIRDARVALDRYRTSGTGRLLSGRVRPKKVLRSPSEETDSGAISLATLSFIGDTL